MAQAMAGKPLITRWNSDIIVGISEQHTSFADNVFSFLEAQEESPKSSCDSIDYVEYDEDENSCSIEENRKFWETQNQLLQVSQGGDRRVPELLAEGVLLRLQAEGYNCAICKSKWKSSQEIPSGEHTYLEVVDKLSSKKGEVRVIIELNFQAEFEMAKASEEYNQLINRLPEIFVGKAERLKALIKILCSAGKKYMKEKKMHLGPWRKHKYMQSKWLGTCERTTLLAPLPVGFSNRPAKPKASMLTYDLLETLPVLHLTAVKVL
ncbi:hypothetical protein GH714_031761 [Hevea brasiliensis]|uniref:Uncharacterized protein n=1 Tax=Hevea brasiliensis TaxID=3981 RepID=A0A6A6L4T7_HEVBR|nr:hypothetical protein GH714_031761 [Hevea brasiliensis]